ncbi:hypothetical protein J6590_071370 [Homalodisca vitripennis]|nr:hypothetical protein J6590_071370 [Homalodisca vitripennis]
MLQGRGKNRTGNQGIRSQVREFRRWSGKNIKSLYTNKLTAAASSPSLQTTRRMKQAAEAARLARPVRQTRLPVRENEKFGLEIREFHYWTPVATLCKQPPLSLFPFRAGLLVMPVFKDNELADEFSRNGTEKHFFGPEPSCSGQRLEVRGITIFGTLQSGNQFGASIEQNIISRRRYWEVPGRIRTSALHSLLFLFLTVHSISLGYILHNFCQCSQHIQPVLTNTIVRSYQLFVHPIPSTYTAVYSW